MKFQYLQKKSAKLGGTIVQVLLKEPSHQIAILIPLIHTKQTKVIKLTVSLA
jgi:hypothetical protein